MFLIVINQPTCILPQTIFLVMPFVCTVRLSAGPEWAAVNMAITLCQNCAGASHHSMLSLSVYQR